STGAEIEASHRVRSEMVESGEIPPLPRDLRPSLLFGSSLFLCRLGFFLIPAFAGYGVRELLA
ncbi:MAG TPA: hypothetical protein VHG69_13520, partial [Thermoleophilaceae bacterium]|nr:hypothetical protein [Thermoleophilaceae bacterium]